MEVREVVRVIRNHWIIAVVGFILAIGLGYLTYANRADAKYSSNATIFVTQGNFPTSLSAASANDAATLTGLAYLYAQIAQSDLISRRIGAPLNSISAEVITTGADSTGNALPFIELSTTATSASGATQRTAAATSALQQYVAASESSTHTPPASRVALQVITAPSLGKPLATRERVVLLPGVVFLTVLLAAFGALFVVENMTRPSRATAVAGPAERDRRSRWLSGRTAGVGKALDEPPTMGTALRQQ